MFHQILSPVAGNLFLSFLVGLIPIAVVLIMLGILRRPAWQTALAGLVIGLIFAIGVWQMPVGLAASSTLNGMIFAILPVMWIVWNAMWLYNIAVRSGKFELTGFRSLRTTWPVALVAGGSFALTQFAVSNFLGPQLPDVLASLVSLLCVIGFVQVWKPRDVEQYRAHFAGTREGTEGSTAIGEEGIPVPVPASSDALAEGGKPSAGEAILAWTPWVMVSAVVIGWTFLNVATVGQQSIKWPGLHNQIFLTLYDRPYAALYNFQPLGTGTAIFLAVVLTSLVFVGTGTNPKVITRALADTWRQLRFAILTVVLIIGLAYLFNYSGIAYTLGLAISKVGAIFPFFAVFLGWIGVFLSGSDTSSNALFGNLQVVAAKQLHLSPVLMAATNSSGGVMGKMVSPQNVTTGVSTSTLVGKEGLIVARIFKHSIFLAVLLGLLVMAQQYLIPWIIPH